MSGRLLANLIAVAAVSGVLLIYGVTQLLTGTLIYDRTYEVHVLLPASGGLLAHQEVTVAGRVVGQVDEVMFDGDGVRVTLSVEDDEEIPVEAEVVVLRRSPLGEQAIDFRPTIDDWGAHAEGAVIEPEMVRLPVEVQGLLRSAERLIVAIEPDEAARVTAELADTFRDRGDDVRELLVDGGRLSETVGDAGAEIDRFTGSGRVIAEELATHREAFTASIADTAELAGVLADMRGDLEGLIAEGPPVLASLDDVVGRAQPNIACTVGSLAAANTYLAGPERQRDIEGLLRFNQWFFVGVEIGAVMDPATGDFWNRVRLLPPQAVSGDSYLPDKRPIPDILPGGACAGRFGDGAPAATQAGYQRAVPEARVVPPADARADPVRREASPRVAEARADAPPADPDARLPATGGDVAPLLAIGLLALGVALLRTRRGTPLSARAGRRAPARPPR